MGYFPDELTGAKCLIAMHRMGSMRTADSWHGTTPATHASLRLGFVAWVGYGRWIQLSVLGLCRLALPKPPTRVELGEACAPLAVVS